MSSAQVGFVLGYLRKLAAARKDEELPDHQLLERFASDRDEAAFAALLKRHGNMVLGVCRSVLRNLHDAEDVFQAAFLVLARKAGSIRRREAVSSWLHRVAYHLAVKSQAEAARRKILERRAVAMSSVDPVLDMSLRELRAVLNQELQQLPEEHRAPLVLCCLEEKSLEEAARLLGWTRSTVKGRLQRGRERLRARLRRRDLELSAGLFASVLSTHSTAADVSAKLAASTLKAALWLAVGREPAAGPISAKVAALVKGATRTMIYNKLKVATAFLLTVSAALAGLGVLRHQILGAYQADSKQTEAPPQKARNEAPTASTPAKPEAPDSVQVHGRPCEGRAG
jgi:RNA polymerase sigma factor (sigma-70 family)